MNKINPLYALGFFVFMAVLMMIQGVRLEGKIAKKAQENAATQMLGKRVASLKKEWKDPQEAQKKIDSVLGLKLLAPKVRTREKKGGIYKVVLEELSANELDKMSAKLLNETLRVKSLKLTRNGDKNVTAAWEFEL